MIITINVLNRHHGYREDGDRSIYIGRGSPLGNPYKIDETHDRHEVLSLYDLWLDEKIRTGDVTVLTALEEIAEKALEPDGVNLICFCAPKPCHGYIIKREIIELLKKQAT